MKQMFSEEQIRKIAGGGIELVNSGEFSGEHDYILFDKPLPTYEEGKLAVYLLAVHQTEAEDNDTILCFLVTDQFWEGLGGSVFYREEQNGINCKINFFPSDTNKLGYDLSWAEDEQEEVTLATLKNQFDESPCYLYKIIG